MRDRFEFAATIIGFAVGIAMGFASLGVLLLQVAPMFKGTKI